MMGVRVPVMVGRIVPSGRIHFGRSHDLVGVPTQIWVSRTGIIPLLFLVGESHVNFRHFLILVAILQNSLMVI